MTSGCRVAILERAAAVPARFSLEDWVVALVCVPSSGEVI